MKEETAKRRITAAQGWLALSPVIVFLLSYVAVSAAIGDFYRMPVAVSLTIASIWAVAIYRGHTLTERLMTLSRAAGHENILYMIWIFVLAGAFASLARSIGAVEATVNLTLNIFPPTFIIPMLFFAACFISLSIGTSVGTVVALTPLAVEMANAAGADVPFYVAVVLGGAFFGDNLSFISDTTIAATRSQDVSMRDKFRANLRIVLPAAVLTLAAYVVLGFDSPVVQADEAADNWLIIPYLVVIITAIIGINVMVVLTMGILTALALGLIQGSSLLDMAQTAGDGIDDMGNLIIVTLLAAGMLGLVKAAGGIDYMLRVLTKSINGRRGAQGIIVLLVGLVNLCTANNTVAIITAGPLARDIADRYGIDRRKSASLLDTASCIVQCLIPYGAQTLLAASLAGISPAAPWPYLYYPWALTLALLISILTTKSPHRSMRSV